MATPNTPVNLPDERIRDAVNMQVTLALGEVERSYKQRIAEFAEELHALNGRLATLRDEIALIEKENEEKQRALQAARNETDAELKYLERLNAQFLKKAELTAELARELADVDETKKKSAIETKHMLLRELLKEIEESEIALLQKELEAQNLQLELEPSMQRIRALKLEISELEAQKHYLESAGTHRLTGPIPSPDESVEEERSEIVETEAE
jgi:chromosome segregation ATPase